MAEEDCSSFNSSTTSNMDFDQQDKKNVSKIFSFLRTKLNAKEKELLELQRASPCLLAPDSEQIDILLDAISSLHLSTQEGSFIFASSSTANDSSSKSVCSTGVDSIKTLPSKIWLHESVPVKQMEQHIEYRLPMVNHLLSLPINAYVASSSNGSTLPSIETKDEPPNRLPMVSQLFSMPINAFKSSTNIQPISESVPIAVEDKKETINKDNNVSSLTEPPKSIFTTESIYSKEHWLRKSSSSESKCESIPLDLDAYIEQTTEKMRRLHMEYLEALEKLKTPSQQVDSSQMIKSMYPQVFDQIKQDMPTKNLSRFPPLNQ